MGGTVKTSIVRLPTLVAAGFVLSGGLLPPPGPLVAHRITHATAVTDLFSGTDSAGGIGDWVLSNGIVHVVIDDVAIQLDLLEASGQLVPSQNGVAQSGGTVVDLGLRGRHNDQLLAITPVINLNVNLPVVYVPAHFAVGDPGLDSIIASEEADRASLTVHGFAIAEVGAPLLSVETEYSLRTNEQFLRIRTELRNETSVPLRVSTFGDRFVHAGGGGTIPFTSFPTRGFRLENGVVPTTHHSVLGRLGPDDGIADADFLRPAGEVSYTVISMQRKIVHAGQNRLVSLVMTIPTSDDQLEPAETFVYERRVYVGERNDVASSADLALLDLLPELGIPFGTVRGRLVSFDGNPFRASLELWQIDIATATAEPETLVSRVAGDASPLPVSHVLTDSSRDGEFEAILPVGLHELRTTVEEREPVAPIQFEILPLQTFDLGTISVSSVGTLRVAVTEVGSRLPLPARITIKGWGNPNPDFGIPIKTSDGGGSLRFGDWGSLPSANRTYTAAATGQADLTLAPGRYRVIASHGPEWSMDWGTVNIAAEGTHSIGLELNHVVDTTGWLAADFHIHASPSADSSVPPEDRIRSYVGEGVEVMVSADHDTIFDYAPVIEHLGLGNIVASMAGVEVTSSSDASIFGTGSAHINGWPVTPQPLRRKNGAPEDFKAHPAVIYDRLHSLGASVLQLNHPTWTTGGGYFTAIGFDPDQPLDAPPNDILLDTSALGTGTRNLDFDVIEVHNGINPMTNAGARTAWFSLLNQGILKTGTAASDSHKIAGESPGYPRTYVAYIGDVPTFDASVFNDALKAMRAFGTSGPFLEVEATSGSSVAGLGETLETLPVCCFDLQVRVHAPSWMPVDELSIYANGERVVQVPVYSFGTSSLRFAETFNFAPAVDTYYVVTVDQNLPPQNPTTFDEALASLVHSTVVFEAFSNPIFVDVDGNGVFDAPGVSATP